jgi:uncharacterized membrane protein YccC
MALARNPFAVFTRISTIKSRLYSLFPGVIVSMIVATTAQFLADHYSTPVMLLALLLGMAVSFLGEEGRTVAGINFTGSTLLRVGVALLGVRISADLIIGLGPQLIGLVVVGVLATILFGLWVARFLWPRLAVWLTYCRRGGDLWCLGSDGHQRNIAKRRPQRTAPNLYRFGRHGAVDDSHGGLSSCGPCIGHR